ncbi:hypothetical protein ACS0TY_030122 [Phlomoides rotata]
MIECSVCHSHSKLVSPSTKAVSRAYDQHRSKVSSKQRVLNFLLVGSDCVLVGLQGGLFVVRFCGFQLLVVIVCGCFGFVWCSLVVVRVCLVLLSNGCR